jgi:hypothetical protein
MMSFEQTRLDRVFRALQAWIKEMLPKDSKVVWLGEDMPNHGCLQYVRGEVTNYVYWHVKFTLPVGEVSLTLPIAVPRELCAGEHDLDAVLRPQIVAWFRLNAIHHGFIHLLGKEDRQRHDKHDPDRTPRMPEMPPSCKPDKDSRNARTASEFVRMLEEAVGRATFGSRKRSGLWPVPYSWD